MRLLALLLLPLAACGARPSGLGGQEGEDLHDTGGGPDGDTADSGTDDTDDTDDTDGTDSGDVDTATDTAVDPDLAGTFRLEAVAADGTADTCTGGVALYVSGTAIAGVGSCSFAGPLRDRFPTGLLADVEGTTGAPGSGTLRFHTAATGDVPWTGAASDAAIDATFAGIVTDGAELTVSGTFSALPD